MYGTTTLQQEHRITEIVDLFFVDRQAQNHSPGTLIFYHTKLGGFQKYLSSQGITAMHQITAGVVRQFLMYLDETHNPGGVHSFYRAVKTFLRWYEVEYEPEDWKNPIIKVKAPKVPTRTLEPVQVSDISILLETCRKGTFTGDRDRAILLCLLDTGARAQEFLDINLDDINFTTGAVLIRMGKGRKPRTVFLGSSSMKAVKAYLKHRTDGNSALWVRDDITGRLEYFGLRSMMVRRAKQAGISEPSLHSFRRAFAINMLRAGVDIYSLAQLMGHSGIDVLKHYLKLEERDIQTAHKRFGPVDNILKM